MSYQKRNSSAPFVKIGDGEGERPVVEGILRSVRLSTKYEGNQLFDIDTTAGPITVPGSKCINDCLSAADIGHAVRLTFAGWQESKAGSRYRAIEVEVDDAQAPEEEVPPLGNQEGPVNRDADGLPF